MIAKTSVDIWIPCGYGLTEFKERGSLFHLFGRFHHELIHFRTINKHINLKRKNEY